MPQKEFTKNPNRDRIKKASPLPSKGKSKKSHLAAKNLNTNQEVNPSTKWILVKSQDFFYKKNLSQQFIRSLKESNVLQIKFKAPKKHVVVTKKLKEIAHILLDNRERAKKNKQRAPRLLFDDKKTNRAVAHALIKDLVEDKNCRKITKEAFDQGLISLLDIRKLAERKTLVRIMNKHCLQMLKAKLITMPFIKSLDFMQIVLLFTPHGLAALEKGLLAKKEIKRLGNAKLSSVLTSDGLRALEKGYIDIEKIMQIDENLLKHLLTRYGVIGLQKELFSIDQIIQLGQLNPALDENQFKQFNNAFLAERSNQLMYLFTPCGLQILENYFRFEEVTQLNADKIKWLASEKGLAILSVEPIEGLSLLKQTDSITLATIEYIVANSGSSIIKHVQPKPSGKKLRHSGVHSDGSSRFFKSNKDKTQPKYNTLCSKFGLSGSSRG